MNTWALSWSGVRTVIDLELRQRIRSRRWIWALIAWFLVIGGIATLIMLAAWTMLGLSRSDWYRAGPLTFGVITLFILGMGLVIAPSFTATSINGDRSAGTLAILQATRLSALEIATGKLIAAWLTSAVFLLVALPFIAWSMVLGSISLWQVLVCFAVVFVLVAVVCAIGLGWSAIISRTAGSTVLTYLSVVALSVLSTVVMALLIPLTVGEHTVSVWGLSEERNYAYQNKVDQYWTDNPDGDGSGAPAPPIGECEWRQVVEQTAHYDRVWWITVTNPFVIVADAAPLPPGSAQNLAKYDNLGNDPLAAIRFGVRQLSQPVATERDECSSLYASSPAYVVESDSSGNLTVTTTSGVPVNVESPVKKRTVSVETPVWPWGLGANLLIGGVFFWIAVRRLRVPYGTLPKGTRVA